MNVNVGRDEKLQRANHQTETSVHLENIAWKVSRKKKKKQQKIINY